MTYLINECFKSLQGEGIYAGAARVFLRFSACNLTCSADNDAGFDCDTEFTSGTKMSWDEVKHMVELAWSNSYSPQVVLTGGEPLLQVDEHFVKQAHDAGWDLYVETNGTQTSSQLPESVWVSVSPKTAEHTLSVARADELRYVRNHTQAIPKPRLKADYYFLSPAWSDDEQEMELNLRHCIKLVRQNPKWRLSVQQHKLWRVQ